jgi:HEPN domain-containing protein
MTCRQRAHYARRAFWIHVSCSASRPVEKYLKALWAHQRSATPPRSHELALLAQDVGAPAQLIVPASDLSNEYLAAHYPDVAGTTPFRRYSEADADRFLNFATEVQQWVLTQLPGTP